MKDTSEYQRRKRRVFDIIQLGNVSDLPSRVFDYFLVAVIIANILAMFLETFDEVRRFQGCSTPSRTLRSLFSASNTRCGFGLRNSFIRASAKRRPYGVS